MAEAKWVAKTTRPEIMGTRYMVSAGHYLAAAAGVRILEKGGNAFDAGVAMGLCINVLQADLTNLGGVAPICLFNAKQGRVDTVSGLGWWPAATDPEIFHKRYSGRILRGIHRCVIPAAVDAWLTTLKLYGTMSLADVAEPAIELCEQGFPMHSVMRETFSKPAALKAMRSWPSTAAVFLDKQENPPAIGELVFQKDLGKTLRLLVEAERQVSGREAGIQAARDRFYRGDIAQAMVKFSQDQGGWLTLEDLAGFKVDIEPAIRTSYRGHEVFSCGPWCQGPVVPMALNILEGFELRALGAGSTETYHLILEALKAAFADRDKYFTDPRFAAVPIDGLLSKTYASKWRERISRTRAFPGMPEPGDPWPHSVHAPSAFFEGWKYPEPTDGPVEPDTSYLCVVDHEGNAFSATPSDGATSAPLVPGYGFSISSRGMQSWLDPNHPSSIAPGKRPRLTPSPGMVLKDGKLLMPYGTPGNDVQPQAMLQFLINIIDFGMGAQEAIEAPRCATYSFPRSSDPHPYTPGAANIEGRVDPDVVTKLQQMGHRIEAWPAWTGTAGSLGAVLVNQENGVLHGAADPRRVAYALGR
jgi:gamma-glutamyltranspeptidase / glutathione hydrolase